MATSGASNFISETSCLVSPMELLALRSPSGGDRHRDRVAVAVSPGCRCRRREGDDGAAMPVAGRNEFAACVLAQQLDAGGVGAVGDREAAACGVGSLGGGRGCLCAFLARRGYRGGVLAVGFVCKTRS